MTGTHSVCHTHTHTPVFGHSYLYMHVCILGPESVRVWFRVLFTRVHMQADLLVLQCKAGRLLIWTAHVIYLVNSSVQAALREIHLCT